MDLHAHPRIAFSIPLLAQPYLLLNGALARETEWFDHLVHAVVRVRSCV
jgi:hypothetical protein